MARSEPPFDLRQADAFGSARAPDRHSFDLQDARLDLYRAAFEPAHGAALFDALQANVAWTRHRVRIGGRDVPCPRLSAWYGEPGVRYRYSGLQLSADGWAAPVAEIRQWVEVLLGRSFNSVLLNLYRDGGDAMGWHSDAEPELGRDPYIASVSFGATRRFKLRHKRHRGEALDIDLDTGSVLVMHGPTQHHWRHCLPRTRRAVGPRINLTFRSVFDPGKLGG